MEASFLHDGYTNWKDTTKNFANDEKSFINKLRLLCSQKRFSLFRLLFASLLLQHSDDLSKSLQHESLSAAKGQHIAKLTLDILKSLRTDVQFTL